MIYPDSFEDIIDFLSKIPGISEKAAERVVLSLGKLSGDDRLKIFNAFKEVSSIHSCAECGFPARDDLCSICSDETRDREVICVVEQPRDAVSIERLNRYKGLYHILGGVISPLEGIGPENLNISKLFERVKHGVRKVIIAINPTVEGEATTKFITDKLTKLPVQIFRIACGIPYGGTIDMSDDLTLHRAFEDMKLLSGG